MRIGLILDGKMVVGKFKWFTCEDCYGKRELSKVVINNHYCDILGYNSSKNQLRFIYVEPIDIENNKYRMIDDFGYGGLQSLGAFCSHDNTHIEKAIFSKEPKRNVN
ncbi:MAG TPA: hypothetical protein VM577_04380 [Anaerovoracaceae bacterium]|nr:hypothetical protein [Anaerovoracaceae bacterium]